jgi:hypothetical protein
MKKSKLVSLGLLTAVSLAVIACDDEQQPPQNEEVKHCLNSDGLVVDESNCVVDDKDAGLVQATDDAGNVIYVPQTYYHGGGGGGPVIFYRWYYGGSSRVVTPGTRLIINGNGYGRFTPSPGHSYSTPSTFGRGGFGATGRGFSSPGGGGHGGGAGE